MTEEMSGRVVVVTGASSGIGAAAAQALHARGAEVHVIGRSPHRTKEVAADLGTEPIIADFACLDEVRGAAEEVLAADPAALDVLANNAGISVSRREETTDGHELMFQVNHLAPFLLTNLLLERLIVSAPTRVITTSSSANMLGFVRANDLDTTRFFVGMNVYATTKLENILFTKELDRRVGGSGVVATCFDPGVVATRFGRRDVSGVLQHSPVARVLRSPEAGADTLVWLATARADEIRPGRFYRDRKLGITNLQARSNGLARRLWERSAAMVGLV